MAAESVGHPRRFRPHRRRLILAPITHAGACSLSHHQLTSVILSASTSRDFATECNDKVCAPCPGAYYPVEEAATPHSGEAQGEMRLEQVGASSARNASRMNGSRESRSSIRIAPVRNIPRRTRSKPKPRNGRTLPLLRDRTASRYFQSRIRLCKSRSYRFGFPSSKHSFPFGMAQEE